MGTFENPGIPVMILGRLGPLNTDFLICKVGKMLSTSVLLWELVGMYANFYRTQGAQ